MDFPRTPQYFRSPTSTPFTPGTPKFNSVVNSAVPGMPALAQSASNIVGSLLGGLPGTSQARRASAYMGGSAGVPGSDFIRNRGFDLYGQQSDAREQAGIQNLLQLLQGFSAPMLQERSQEIQREQFGAQFKQGQLESDRDYGLRSMQAEKLYGPKFRGMAGTVKTGLGGFNLSAPAEQFQRATGRNVFAQ